MKEIVDFKYKEHGRDDLNNKKHSHNNCYEILQIWSGDGVIMMKNKLYPIKSGWVYFINGMDIHCSVPKNPDEYVRSKIVIESEYINKIANLTGSSQMIYDLFIKDGGTCIEWGLGEAAGIDEELLKINDSLNESTIYTNVTVATSLFNIFCSAHSNKNAYNAPLSNKISKVLEYINKNIERKITLDEICDHVHVSKYYLCRTFKETTHLTILDYILFRRISIAKKKLLYSDMPLSDIAISSGFCSFSYFSKMFRLCEGVTPSQFRKSNAL
jgi:AraC-like DNA-binding protein